jgi:hypothetical protein
VDASFLAVAEPLDCCGLEDGDRDARVTARRTEILVPPVIIRPVDTLRTGVVSGCAGLVRGITHPAGKSSMRSPP